MRFLVHDRDAKFSRAFDVHLATEGIKVNRTPVQAPNANAHMERWVCSARRECLDRLLIVSLRPPDLNDRSPVSEASTPATLQATRRDLLGGLIHE